VSLSTTLSKNEKIEQHMKKKTHKPNVLMLGWRWCHSLVCWALILILVISSVFISLIFPTSGIRTDGLWWWSAQTHLKGRLLGIQIWV